MPHPGRLPTVFFLSDYGTEDEFVGVVHAVLLAAAPQARIVDLTHQCPAFDVRAGAHTLARAVPHLGPGVVLAVVDPGWAVIAGPCVCSRGLGPGDRPSYSSARTTASWSPPPNWRPKRPSAPPTSWSHHPGRSGGRRAHLRRA